MILSLVRYWSNTDRTLGKLFIDGKFECFTLEDEFRNQKIKGETRIPAGSYKVELRYSPKFTPRLMHEMLWLKDVPGFEFILIHPGNDDDDTEGCILVGKNTSGPVLLRSREAYFELYNKICTKAKDKDLSITVIDYDRN